MTYYGQDPKIDAFLAHHGVKGMHGAAKEQLRHKEGTVAEPTAAQRKMFAKMHLAMPDGSYYIRNGTVGAEDLDNAIKAVGRGEAAGDSGTAIRIHIMKRAAALKLSSKIPDTWNSDGTLKPVVSHAKEVLSYVNDPAIDAFLAHHGVLGMKWGQHKAGSESYGSTRERTQAIHAARVAHIQRMSQIDSHVHNLQEAKTPAEKQKQLDAIHKLAKDPQAAKELDIAQRSTLGEKIISGVGGSIVGPLGTAAGVTGQQAYRAHKRGTEGAKLDAYANSKVGDYGS